MQRRLFASVLTLTLLSSGPSVSARERYAELTAVTHLHSSFSHGARRDLDSLARELRAKGVDVFITTDHVVSAWEYGLWPLRGLLRRRVVEPSILGLGARRYLKAIADLRRKYPDLIVIPGAEAAAFYRWEGGPRSGLRLVDWNRHLLVLGLERAEDYERMPVAGNPRAFPLRAALLLPLFLLGLAGLWIAFGWRRCGAAIGAAALVLIVDVWPMRSSPWPPYVGQTPWGAYQNLIDYAAARGGLTFWAHPDAVNWNVPVRVAPRVEIRTSPYPEALLKTRGHNGFAALFEGERTAARPGMQWDQALREYGRGERATAPWALAELDYNDAMPNPNALDAAQIRLWVSSRTAAGVMEALRAGRFYAEGPVQAPRLSLSRWTVSDGETARAALSGESLQGVAGPAALDIALDYADGSAGALQVQIVRDGAVLLEETSRAPYARHFLDTARPAGPSFYRIFVRDSKGTMIFSNPIFVNRGI